jgi:AAA family ATP:ADP antiporter
LLRAVLTFMCVMGAGVVARTAGSALFLSRYPASALSYMYIASAALLIVVALAVAWLVPRVTPARLLTGAAGALVIAAIGLRLLLLTPWKGAAIGVYLFGDLLVRLPVMLFWSVATSMFNPREGKRLFVIIGTAGTLACVIIGVIVGPFSHAFGTENLILVMAALMVAFGLAGRRMIATAESLRAPDAKAAPAGGLRNYAELLTIPQVRLVCGLIVATTATLLLSDFLFKSQSRVHYTGAALAGFFGNFFSAVSLTGLTIQLFLSHQVLRRGGVFVAIVMLPVAVMACALGVSLTGAFGWIIAAKFSDSILDFSLNSAGVQLLYLGIRKQSRGQARAFIEGVARPATTAFAGLALVVGASVLSVRGLGVAVAVGTVLWILAARGSYRSYVAGLIESIGVRRFDPSDESSDVGDPLVEMHVRNGLRVAGDRETLYLIGVMQQLTDVNWHAEYRELLNREKAEVLVAALQYFEKNGAAPDAELVRPSLTHSDPLVRTAAVHAIARLTSGNTTDDLTPLLEDTDVEVRAAATAELINIGDLDGLLGACVTLKARLRTEDAKSRAAAANVLSRVSHAGLSRILSDLLADTGPDVRRAALAACAARPDKALLPAVLRLLGDPEMSIVAADALTAFGPAVIPHLESFASEARARPSEAHLLVPGVLASTRNAAALPLLAAALDVPNIRVRAQVVSAYCQLLTTLGAGRSAREGLAAIVQREIGEAQMRATVIQSLAGVEGGRLLRQVLEEERTALLGNAFLIMGVMHPDVDMKSIGWILRQGSADQRAEALEVLDNVLTSAVKPAVFAVFEVHGKPASAASNWESRVAEFLRHEHSEWVVASAAFMSGRQKLHAVADAMRDLLKSESAFVREAARDALTRIGANPGEPAAA